MSKKIGNPAIGRAWDEVERELYTPEEIAESNSRVDLIGERIRARQKRRIRQKKVDETLLPKHAPEECSVNRKK